MQPPSPRLSPLHPSTYSRRLVWFIVVAFLILQGLQVTRAALPLPKPLKSTWPWRMFDRRSPWDKHLEAIGFTADGKSQRIPLEALFTYTRGFTPLRAYDQVPGLNQPKQTALHQSFAQYLYRRMHDRGIELVKVELAWNRIHLDTGKTQRQVLGTYPVGPVAPATPEGASAPAGAPGDEGDVDE